ncbi:MAG TPA: YfhO family protein [Flavobacterium sp.]|jgi:hypothetical protein
MKFLQKFYPHLLAIAGFVLASLIYFYPVLQGKQIFQSDIAQYTGMAKEQNDFRAAEHAEPYWTNSAFGGMPTYQLGANYPHNYVKMLDSALRFLPRPADYMFLYFLGFYVLLLVLRTSPLKAFIGALAFGFSTYLIIILGVGHNAKAHAIGYMPLVVAGVIMVFQRRFIAGGLLTMLAAALEINANHFQMTYYLLLLLLVISVYFIYELVKQKEFRTVGYSIGVFVVAGILAVGANATNLMATSEYAKFSTRGKSDLTFLPDGTKRVNDNALSNDYITEYSYGLAESFNLIAPRLFGGSNSENLGTDSHVYEYIIAQGAPEDQARDFASALPTYWGDQPIVAAPAYIGAVVFFFCIIALFVDRRKIKYAFLAGAILSLLLSWGKNFPALTDFFINYVPLYSSFRAVSSIQVLLELCIPVLAIMGLQSFFREEKDLQMKMLMRSAATSLGIFVLLFLMKGTFSFAGGSDSFFMQNYGADFVEALKDDRRSMYSADLLRSFFMVLVAFGILWMFVKDRLARNTSVILIGIIMIGDLFFVDKRYLDNRSFLSPSEIQQPFEATASDLQILKDTSYYRVFEINGNLSSARASYFHKSIGGYHAAKPGRFQELFDYQIAKNNLEVLNMLNVKYVLQTDEKGQEFPVINPDANGNAWFVEQVKFVNSADEEMKSLDKLDTKKTAVVNRKDFGKVLNKATFVRDSSSVITLTQYKPNYLKYTSNNSQAGLAVFSEAYYANGWNAYLDGKKQPHFRANYILRAMMVPAGRHTIEFRFEPQVVKTGSNIALISSLIMLLLIGGGIWYEAKRNRRGNAVAV